MVDTYSGTVLLATILGLLGGALVHIRWLLSFGKTAATAGKPPSNSKRAKRLRIALMVLAIGLGGAAGFIVGLLGHDQRLPLIAVMTLALLSGLSIAFFVRWLKGFGP